MKGFVVRKEVKISTWMLLFRGGSRTAASSKMEHFEIIVNG